jgi:hypothetical protein
MLCKRLKNLVILLLLPCLLSIAHAQSITPSDIDAAFQKQFGPLSKTSDDSLFLRRLLLDIEGRIPTLKELQNFKANKNPNKRLTAIKKALQSQKSAQFLGQRFANRLLEKNADPNIRRFMNSWTIKTLAANRSFKDVATDLIAMEGEATKDFAGLFLLQYRGVAPDAATAVARQFFGVSIDCARCHDHPFADWKQTQFHSFSANFGRLRVRRIPSKPQRFELYESPIGDYRFKLHKDKTSKAFKPTSISGQDLSATPKRRQALSQTMTAGSENGGAVDSYFVRSAANRIFQELFGTPLIGNPTDINPPGQDPALLKILAKAFIERDYKLRALRQLILQSKAYQRKNEVKGADQEASVSNLPKLRRPLAADQLAASFLVATGRDSPAPGELKFLHDAMKRAMTNELEKLGRSGPEGQVFGSSVRQALRLINGQAINGLIKAKPGRVLHQLLSKKISTRAKIKELCTRVLQRPPSPKESARWNTFVTASKSQSKEPFEDLYWALIASSEFACQR